MSSQFNEQVFTVDNRPVFRKLFLANMSYNGLLAGFCMLMIYIVIRDGFIKEAYTIIFLFVSLEVAFILASYLYAIRIKKKTPSQISVFSDKMMIDGQTYLFSEIVLISLTPPSYRSGSSRMRVLTLNGSNGQKQKYYLGLRGDKQNKIFPEYENLSDLLFTQLKDDPGKFQFDL